MKRNLMKGLRQLGWALCVVGLPLLGQDHRDSLHSEAFKSGMGLGLGGGLKGITAQLSYYFHPHWSLRAEINGLRIQDLSVDVNFSGQVLNALGNVDLFNGGLVLDYFPAPKRSSFHVFAGLSHAFRQRLQGRGSYAQAVDYGEIRFEGEDIGYVDVQIIPNAWMPQMGIAFGRSRPKRASGLRLELGTYYWSAPQVRIEATRMLANTALEADKLAQNLRDYRWWPFVNIALNFRL